MSSAICPICGSVMPWVVTEGVPMRRPDVTNGDRGIVRNGVLVERDSGAVQRVLGVLAGQLGIETAQVDEHQVVVGATAKQAGTLLGQALCQRPGVGHDLMGVVGEARVRQPRGTPLPCRR